MSVKILLILSGLIMLAGCGTNNTDPENLAAPADLSLTLQDQTEVQLSWTDNSASETGFLIQRKLDDGQFVDIFITQPNVMDYLDSEVDELSLYYYRVAALDDDDQSEWSNVASIFTHPTFNDLTFGTISSFEIMTWNLEHFPKNNEITLAYVTDIIKALDVDLIALQEIESSYYFNQLNEDLDDWDGYRATGAYANINLAYLYKSGSISVNDIYEIYTGDSYAFPRSPLVIEFNFSGELLIAINNHYKAQESGSEDEDRRLQASIKLHQYIENYHPDDQVIVLGDLNDEINEPENSNVFWIFIDDQENYLFTDMDIANGPPSNWSYPSWPSHLDHILISNELFAEFNSPNSVVQTILLDSYLDDGWDEYDENVSDHRPVALKLYF
ncbi:MAG: endonuclease/exonuclease/phosphatase family protein [Candidatus Cloacimonetes bacterium]|nr:endonuclease/exonuclease/phosphatase family protein [Candidatus Cloacimonadota bacterium]